MIVDLTLIGVAIALWPTALTSFLLIMASEGGTRKAAAFLFGWILALALVIAVTVAVTGNSPPKPSTPPSLTVLAIKIVLGVMLLLIGADRYRRLGKPRAPKDPPRWQAGIDGMSPWYALALAAFVSPSVLVASGSATVVEARLSGWITYVALIYFCLLSASGYLALEIYALVRPVTTQAFLVRMRTWLDSHTEVLVIWISVIVGLWLVGKSTYLIVTT